MGWTQLTAHPLVLDVLRPRILPLRRKEHHAIDIDSSVIISKKEVSREIHVDEEGMEHRCRDQTPRSPQRPITVGNLKLLARERVGLRQSLLAQKGRTVSALNLFLSTDRCCPHLPRAAIVTGTSHVTLLERACSWAC